MTDTRDKFELKISMEYEQPPCLDRDGDGYDDSYVDNAWWGWQAATEQSQKEIELLLNQQERLIALVDEKDARIAELEARLNVDFPLLVKLFDNIDELQAREKELVEALRYVNKELIMYGYQYESKDSINVVLSEALANVRGE